METHMDSRNEPLLGGAVGSVIGRAVLVVSVLVPIFFLNGCSMTPEDKAFYGRGWINPDELDQEPPPPRSFTDPTAIDPQPLPPSSRY
jgi:hypothetical protein